MLNHILAKYHKDKKTGEITTETLVQHTEFVLDSLDKLRTRTLDLSDEFWDTAYITCLFHDAGKVAQNFQNSLGGNSYDYHMRHELLSGFIVWFFSKEFFCQKDKHVAALYSHHKRLNSELIENDNSIETSINLEDLCSWFDFIEIKVNEKGLDYRIPQRNYIEKLARVNPENYKDLFQHHFYDHFKNQWNQKDRLEYISAKAVLNISDWSASGHFCLSEALIFDDQKLLEALKKKLIIEGKSIENLAFKEFQLKGKINSNVLAIAPTGSGKTEASLIWASQKNEYDKIIYCLPTRVTSNAIYERLKGYFDNSNCSVVHSSALLYLKEVDPDYESRKYLRDKTFFSNITVCTIDQLLTQGFNLGFWEVKTFHCKNASIIIDEIHLYSPYTLALILKTIEYLRENFQTRFFIMSATMPTKLRSLISDALGGEKNFRLIQDTELLEKSRNTFETRDITIQDNLTEIKEVIRNKDKVLIVVNTVDQAIELYQKLTDEAEQVGKHCICFHSRFIQKDRQEIEKNILRIEAIGEPILLIATQVVEVSLDIDFDILFTENAPIDAIIQRAGRINRKRNAKKNSKVIVHPHIEVSKEYIYTETDILDKTFEILNQHNGEQITEGDFLDLVDTVYQDIDVTQKPSFREGEKAFYEVQSTYHFLGDCPPDSKEAMTRDGLDTINVIPDCFYEDLQLRKVNKFEKVKYELSISRKRYKSSKSDSDGFKYVNYEYNNKIGLQFPKNSHSSSSTRSY